jgi:dCMP deaminase
MVDSDWTNRFFNLAQEYSTWSKDPSTKIGAIAVNPTTKRILSGGYNGFPRGMNDSEERLNDRTLKYLYVVHAEKNMIYNATLAGISLNESHVYVYGLPVCSECAKGLIQVGVKKIFIQEASILKSPFWHDSWNVSKAMFEECGVEVAVI